MDIDGLMDRWIGGGDWWGSMEFQVKRVLRIDGFQFPRGGVMMVTVSHCYRGTHVGVILKLVQWKIIVVG